LKSLEIAKRVFTLEVEAIQRLAELLDNNFLEAVEKIVANRGHIVVTGMGKSGHIGAKIAATFASTGTPSFFMHPAEAMHGDLGMLTKNDIVLAISNSGESDEIVKIIPFIKTLDIPLIGLTGKEESTLGKASDCFLNISIEEEASPLGLAPMSSTTVSLVMGDALATAVMEARNFKKEDFALCHPAGSLGRRLLLKVKDIMHTKTLPLVKKSSTFQEVIEVMTRGKLGLCIVVKDKNIVGIITDGDLRRALERTDRARFELLAEEIMTLNPKIIGVHAMAVEAEELMLSYKINELLVVNEENHLVGVVQLFDIGGLL